MMDFLKSFFKRKLPRPRKDPSRSSSRAISAGASTSAGTSENEPSHRARIFFKATKTTLNTLQEQANVYNDDNDRCHVVFICVKALETMSVNIDALPEYAYWFLLKMATSLMQISQNDFLRMKKFVNFYEKFYWAEAWRILQQLWNLLRKVRSEHVSEWEHKELSLNLYTTFFLLIIASESSNKERYSVSVQALRQLNTTLTCWRSCSKDQRTIGDGEYLVHHTYLLCHFLDRLDIARGLLTDNGEDLIEFINYKLYLNFIKPLELSIKLGFECPDDIKFDGEYILPSLALYQYHVEVSCDLFSVITTKSHQKENKFSQNMFESNSMFSADTLSRSELLYSVGSSFSETSFVLATTKLNTSLSYFYSDLQYKLKTTEMSTLNSCALSFSDTELYVPGCPLHKRETVLNSLSDIIKYRTKTSQLYPSFSEVMLNRPKQALIDPVVSQSQFITGPYGVMSHAKMLQYCNSFKTRSKLTAGPIRKNMVYPATQFKFHPTDCTWRYQFVRVILHNKLILHRSSEGTFRDLYNLSVLPVFNSPVAKRQRASNHHSRIENYLVDIIMQDLSVLFAHSFNEECGEKFARLRFLRSDHIQVFSDEDRLELVDLYNVEPSGHGRKFKKFTNNAEYLNKELSQNDKDLLTAFSHFTNMKTDGKIMIVDLQGFLHLHSSDDSDDDKETKLVELTDPAVHSECYDVLGTTNLKAEGFRQFYKYQHPECNAICDLLCLKRPSS